MSLRVFALLPVAALTAGLVTAGAYGRAFAHEHRAVGNYELTVGFLNEPALANEPNGLSVEVMFFADGVPSEEEEAGGEHTEEEGEPVEGLEETLQAEVIVGGGAAKKTLKLEPAFGEPGRYESVFIPTIAGDYTFRVFGKIEDLDVDESFESGPGRFDSVADASELQFPEAATSDGNLAQTVEELQAEVDSLGNGSSDGTARALGVAGVVVGLAGLAAGGFAATRRRN